MVACENTYSVLIVSSSKTVESSLSELLDVRTFRPIVTASSGSEARRLLILKNYDLVVINSPLSDEFGSDLALQMVENASLGVILLVKSESFEDMCNKVEDYGVLTVAKPISRQFFYQITKLLIAVGQKCHHFENENKKLQVKMEEVRLVSRAKCVLIQYLNMNEAQAHKYIERQAMDMRISKKSVAENILNTYCN